MFFIIAIITTVIVFVVFGIAGYFQSDLRLRKLILKIWLKEVSDFHYNGKKVNIKVTYNKIETAKIINKPYKEIGKFVLYINNNIIAIVWKLDVDLAKYSVVLNDENFYLKGIHKLLKSYLKAYKKQFDIEFESRYKDKKNII